MAYNVLSGTVKQLHSSSIALTGTFTGDGSDLAFPNSQVPEYVITPDDNRLITFTNTVGKALRGEANLTFDGTNLLLLDGATTKVSFDNVGNISASAKMSASYYYGDGRYLTGITASGGGSANAQGPVGALQFQTGSGGISGSSAVVYSSNHLKISGTLTITGSVLPSGSSVYDLGSPAHRWASLYVGTGSVHLGPDCTITSVHGGMSFNKTLFVTGGLIYSASSYQNWGSVTGSSGYGLRDNAGTIQFKHTGGDWANIGSGTGSSGQTFPGPVGAVPFLTSSTGTSGSALFKYDVANEYLVVDAGLVHSRTQITTNHTAAVNEYYLGVRAASVEILFDATQCANGQTYVIKDEVGSASPGTPITLRPSASQTIDNSATASIDSPFGAANLYTDGTNWFIC
jgi:hypothetical protein